MATPAADPFAQLAVQSHLTVTSRPITVAPRDILHPPGDSDQYFLVTVSAERTAAGGALYSVFVTPPATMAPPTVRDVLWWLAADAWAVERAARDAERWAAAYGYSLDDAATTRQFELHLQQADTLRSIVGDVSYHRLLALYEREISAEAT